MKFFDFDPKQSISITNDTGKTIDAYGVRVTSEKVLKARDFSNLTKDSVFESSHLKWRETARLDMIQEGSLVYVQKGNNTLMSHPYIISSIQYNVNSQTNWSIKIKFEPTYARSQWVELYMQLPDNPKTHNTPVNLWRYSEYTGVNDGTLSQTQDNGGFIPVPDQKIIESYPDDFESETILTQFI